MIKLKIIKTSILSDDYGLYLIYVNSDKENKKIAKGTKQEMKNLLDEILQYGKEY